MKFKVLKPFFKLSNRVNYNIDDIIELSKEDAQAMLSEGYLEESKSKEATKKEATQPKKDESAAFKISTKND